MGKRWSLYLLALLGCIGFYVAYQGWLAWVLLWTVVCLPVFTLLISLPAMCTTRIQLDCAGYPTLGSRDPIRIAIHCKLPMPAYRCRIFVQRPLTGESWRLRVGASLPADHVGTLICRLERCRVYDYLGLFFLPVGSRGDTLAVVRPMAVEIPQLPDFQSYLALAWRPKPGGGYAENHELRLYRPGDPLNQVHWKLTAKTGKLTLREPMEPLRGKAVISLDLNGTPAQLDRKLGQLLYLGKRMLSQGLPFQLSVLTAQGTQHLWIDSEQTLLHHLDSLLLSRPATEGTLLGLDLGGSWHWHIGGDAHET